MRILGIDPGSRRTGWGLLGGDAQRPRLLECGLIRLPARVSLPERLHRLSVEVATLARRCDADAAAVETPFHGINARSALQLAQARGVILAALAGAGLPVAEYEPATIKKSIAGSGRADKAQVQQMVCRLLAIREPLESEDVSDALAVAWCHLTSHAFRAAVSQALERDTRGTP